MAQFTVHRNPNPTTRGKRPYLLDVQSDLLEPLDTRIVVPLCSVAAMQGNVVKRLMPILTVDNKQYVMLTPQLAGVRKQDIGAAVAHLTGSRDAILAALDLVIIGF